jgi:peptidyl-prolyl cis-trans isomerase C
VLLISSGYAPVAWSEERPQQGPLAAELFVNDAAISQGQIDTYLKTLLTGDAATNQGMQELAQDRKAAWKELVSQEALAQAAIASGLEQDPELKDALAYARRELLASAYIQNYFNNNAVTEQMLKAGYEWKRSNGKILEYNVRQVLVGTRREAEDIIARLDKGEDFVALTRLSKDPGGNSSGGLVTPSGWFRPDTFVDPYFCDAVESLKVGKYTREPLRTRFGWHVIKLDAAPRPVDKPEAYEQLHASAREALRQKTVQRKLNELIASTVNGAKLADASGKAVAADSLGFSQ